MSNAVAVNGAAPTAITPSPSNRSKFRGIRLSRTISKDKAACEFYDEKYLDEGELPSLGTGRKINTTSIQTEKEEEPAAVVTPSYRSKTPKHKNKFSLKKKKDKESKKDKKDKKSGGGLLKRRNEVVIEGRELSPDSKRKHKAFWSQMNTGDESSSDEDAPEDEKKNVEKVLQTPEPVTTTRGRTTTPVRGRAITPRKTEVAETQKEESTAQGIIGVITDLCTDCGWGGDEKKAAPRAEPDYVADLSNQIPVEEEESVNRDRAIFDGDDATLDSITFDSRASDQKYVNHTDACENTAIEVEYYDAGVPDDEITDEQGKDDHDGEYTNGFLQLNTSGDVAAFARPNSNRATSDVGASNFTSPDSAYMLNKSQSWSNQDKNAYLQAMAKKAKEDFLKKKNGALNETMETAYISVDNSERRIRNANDDSNDSVDSIDDVLGSMDKKESTPLASKSFDSNFVSPRTALRARNMGDNDSDSPNNVSDLEGEYDNSPEKNDFSSDISKPLMLNKVKSDLPESQSLEGMKARFAALSKSPKSRGNKDKSLEDAYELGSKGSIISLGKKKKAKRGNFYQLGDEDEETEAEYSVAPRSTARSIPFEEEKKHDEKSRPGDDIFDFDQNESFVDSPEKKEAPFGTVKLDPREDSCDVSVLGHSLAYGGDGASTVITARSMYTTGTNATNFSTSTRRRHRGAAKNRVSKDASENQRPSGWLDSIKAAAEKNNRRWDPKIGWVDYVEPNDQKEKESKFNSGGRIGRLKAPKLKKEGDDSTSVVSESPSVSSNVPFPESWKKDRDSMIVDDDGNASAMTEVISNNKRQNVQNRRALNLHADNTIEEGDEEDSDSSNSDSSDSDSTSSTENVEVPEKGKLFQWIGKPDDEQPNTRTGLDSQVDKSHESSDHRSLGQDSDGGFEQNHNSFDFSATESGKDEDASENDGFEVIEDSRGKKLESSLPRRSEVKREGSASKIGKELDEVGMKVHQFAGKSPTFKSSGDGDRSVSSHASKSSRVQEWLQKVEDDKKKDNISGNAKDLGQSTLFVSAVDDDSTFEYKKRTTEYNDDDSVFEFDAEQKSKTYRRKQGEKAAPHFTTRTTDKKVDDLNDTMSEITSPSEVMSEADVNKSPYQNFMKRLNACSAPVFEEFENGQSMPQAHLAFMRGKSGNESGDSGIMGMIKNQTFCGSPENVHESGLPPRAPSSAGSGTKRTSGIANKYLQSIKEKSAQESVKNEEDVPLKRNISSNSSSSVKSESWKKFLEKRNKALRSSGGSVASGGSRSATEYASSKINEVMERIARESSSRDESEITLERDSRAKSAMRLRPPSSSNLPRSLSTGRARPKPYTPRTQVGKDNAARAAEDLAAAKVEAMMSMMSDTHLEQGEI